ncbi:aldo/keto reductase [Phenylobacterium sp.]|uniref:aldo/keto reductase n=1 Tax=Phenylobacterium sp. TaxID=1871053 RepID=UPI0025F02A63|nr:aldo/keto reductase [Phenylobacterium sp.]MBX3484336.1 aldo/keto reductase [Phenylobacterium sp.]
MERRAYCRTGPDVGVLTYGAMTIAADPGLRDGVAPSLLAALEAGVNLVDTARVYPGSEEIVAATLKAWRGPAPLVSTKVRSRARDAYRFACPVAEAYPPEGVRESVEASLKALGRDTLDIVHLHQWHYAWTHDLSWLETLQALRGEGKLRFIAVSVQDHEHDAALELVSRGLVDGVQVIAHLFESRPANALLPLCEARGLGVIARCVLDSGGLTGALGEADFAARTFLKHAPPAEYAARLRALGDAFVPDVAGSLTELALRFTASLPGVSTLALGLSETRFVDEAVAALARGPLPADTVAAIRREHVWSRNFYEKLL